MAADLSTISLLANPGMIKNSLWKKRKLILLINGATLRYSKHLYRREK